MEEATLKYVGDFDASKIITQLKIVDEEFLQTEKVAQTAFTGVSNAEEQAASIAKTTAAFRAALRRENSDDTAKTAEKDAESLARIQARQEQEYLRTDAQARAAEASLDATFFDRKIAVEKEFHATRMSSLAGNDAAMEAEIRRHEATVARLQSEGMVKVEGQARQLLQRVGTLGNQFQGLQMAFMGVSAAAGETDSKFGQMIGRAGLMTSGLMGMVQVFEMAKSSLGGMTMGLGGALAGVVAVGLAIGVLLEHQQKLKELASKNDWFGDPAKFAEVAAAVNDYDSSVKKMNEAMAAIGPTSDEMTVRFGGNVDAALKAEDAMDRIRKVTGLTREELQKLYGDLQQAQEGWKLVSDQRIIQANYELQRSLVSLEEEGFQKQREVQAIANAQAINNIKAHYEEIKADVKKTTAEKLKAKEDEGKELAVREETNKNMLAAIDQKEVKQKKSDDADSVIAQFVAQQSKIFEAEKKLKAAHAREVAEDEKKTNQIDVARARLADTQAHGDRLKLMKLAEARELESVQLNEQAKIAIKRRYALLEEDIQKETMARSGAVLSQGLSAAMGAYRHHGAEYKAWAEAKNAVDTALAAMAAYESAASIPYVGWIAAPVAAAAAVAVGIENAGTIKDAHFATGGMLGKDRVTRYHFNETGEEGVLSPVGVAAAGGANGVNALNSGRGMGHTFNLGDTYVQASPGMSQTEARRIGRTVAEAKYERLAQLAADLKDIPYLNIPQQR